MTVNRTHFCMCPALGALSEEDQKRLASHRAALLDAAMWQPGDLITIRFLDGDSGLQKRVKDAALEWTEHANLTLDFRNSGPTDIRIAFAQGRGSWSYLGRQCRQIAEPAPTMNYGWLTPASEDDELRRVVLHEFGHALGLIHEHQNPKDGGVQWNRDAIIKDLSGPPNNWDLTTIENNMFKKYDGVTASAVDNDSIMMYPIPLAWTLDGTSANLNKTLSPLDKEFIAQHYPR